MENELMDVIAMTSSCIERRENKLKKNTAKQAQEKANKTEIKLKQEKQNTKNILKEITQNIDKNGKLNPKTLQKILTMTKEM